MTLNDARTRRGRLGGCIAVTALLLLGAAGCRQDMHNQPKYKAYRESHFFEDRRQVRPLVAGVVPRGHLDEEKAFFTGADASGPVATNPLPLRRETLLRGQERFNIYCSPCHDRTANGNGMVVQRGYKQPNSFHIDRLRSAPDGYFFQAMTNGFGTMPSYAAQVPARDRWAIVAYIRALQFAQYATLADVPAAERATLEAAQ